MAEMTDTTTRIAQRIVQAMISIATNQAASKDMKLEMFKGLGMALAFVFEETQGKSAINRKPKELMEWAISLPEPHKTLVTLN
jgi:hypothetical protein